MVNMTENVHTSWHSINITVSPEVAEVVEFAFNELGALGTEINHLRKSLSETVVVIGYFNSVPDEELVRFELGEALRIYGMPPGSVLTIESKKVEDTDWLAEWKKHWKPTEIGKFIITPPWEEVNAPGKIVIKIEPNMAFGTGTHETTQLCLRAIEKKYEAGQSFLDIGTGTGILAIAAAKLHSRMGSRESGIEENEKRILACDTDVDSVAIARENTAANEVGKFIELYVGSISNDSPRADFICANLTIDVILPILPLLIAKTKGTLVLSGILHEQKESIVSGLTMIGVADYEVEHAGEWISLVTQVLT